MKIAQIAPLMENVPPRLYGGTERIVSYLTEELVRLGGAAQGRASPTTPALRSTARSRRCAPLPQAAE